MDDPAQAMTLDYEKAAAQLHANAAIFVEALTAACQEILDSYQPFIQAMASAMNDDPNLRAWIEMTKAADSKYNPKLR